MELGWTLARVRDVLGGQLHGPEDMVVERFCRLELARANDISFVREVRYVEPGVASAAGALIVWEKQEAFGDRPQIVVPDVMMGLLQLLAVLNSERAEPIAVGVHPTAVVDPTVELGDGAAVGPLAVIEADAKIGARTQIGPGAIVGRRASLGEDTVVHPRAVIHHDVEIGSRVIIWSNAVIGRDGFGFVPTPDGTFVRLPHLGTVIIEDDAEIGACATVDRAMIDETVIGRAVKIDAHCHVAHNCRIGARSMLAGYTKMAGSVTIGEGCLFAADASINEHLTIGDGAMVGAAARLRSDIPAGESWFGYPAVPAGRARRILAAQASLPEMRKLIKRIAKKLDIDLPKPGSS